MKYCPRCLRTEASFGECPNNDFPGMNCPEPKEEDPTTDINIACGPCDFTRVVPIKMLLTGAAKQQLPACRRDDCACVVVAPEGSGQPVPPAPVASFDTPFDPAGAFDPVMPELREKQEAEGNALPESNAGAAQPEPAEGITEESPSATPAETSPSKETPAPARQLKVKNPKGKPTPLEPEADTPPASE